MWWTRHSVSFQGLVSFFVNVLYSKGWSSFCFVFLAGDRSSLKQHLMVGCEPDWYNEQIVLLLNLCFLAHTAPAFLISDHVNGSSDRTFLNLDCVLELLCLSHPWTLFIYTPTHVATPSTLITTYSPLKIITYSSVFEKPHLKIHIPFLAMWLLLLVHHLFFPAVLSP